MFEIPILFELFVDRIWIMKRGRSKWTNKLGRFSLKKNEEGYIRRRLSSVCVVLLKFALGKAFWNREHVSLCFADSCFYFSKTYGMYPKIWEFIFRYQNNAFVFFSDNFGGIPYTQFPDTPKYHIFGAIPRESIRGFRWSGRDSFFRWVPQTQDHHEHEYLSAVPQNLLPHAGCFLCLFLSWWPPKMGDHDG